MSWSDRARAAALTLSTGEEREDESVTALLLRDIHGIFNANGSEGRLATAGLLAELHKIEESPWGDWYGKPLSAHGLSRLLKAHRIKTMPVWTDGETVRGYKVEQFADAFDRVVGVRSVSSVRSGLAPGAAPNSPNAPNAGYREGNGRLPVSGDPGFPDWVDKKLQDGHLTETEWIARRKLHHAVVEAA